MSVSSKPASLKSKCSHSNRVKSPTAAHMADKLYSKDGMPLTSRKSTGYLQGDGDDGTSRYDQELWNVTCGHIDRKYISTNDGKVTLEKLKRRLRREMMMSLSSEIAELNGTEKTVSALFVTLCKRFENRSSTVANFYAVQRLKKELLHMRYNNDDGIEDHLRQITRSLSWLVMETSSRLRQ